MRFTASRSQRVDRAGHREIGLAGAGRADAEGDVVLAGCCSRYCDLARRAAVQVGPARHQRGCRRPRRARGGAAARPRSGRAACRRCDRSSRAPARRNAAAPAPRAACCSGVAAQREVLAAARDRDVERGLDLAQVFVERAAQVGEALVVDRRETSSTRSGLQGVRVRSARRGGSARRSSPRSECGSAAVMRDVDETARSGARRRRNSPMRLLSVRAGKFARVPCDGALRPARAARVPTIALADRARACASTAPAGAAGARASPPAACRRPAPPPACRGAGCRRS